LISLCFHRQGASVFATERADLKLDAQNEPGVFLGLITWRIRLVLSSW